MLKQLNQAWKPYRENIKTDKNNLVRLSFKVCKMLDPNFNPPLIVEHKSYEGIDGGLGYWVEKSVIQYGDETQGVLYVEERESFQDGITPSPTDLTQELKLYGAANGCEFHLVVDSNFHRPKYAKVKMVGEEKAINKSLKTLRAKFEIKKD